MKLFSALAGVALVLALGISPLAAQSLEVPAVPEVKSPTLADAAAGADSLLSQFRNSRVVAKGDWLRTIAAAEYGDYRLWPVIYLANREIIANPEVIEPGQELKIYQPPFDPRQAPNDLQKMAMAKAYVETYKAYLPLGAAWQPARRWVLSQALQYDPALGTTFASDIEASDRDFLK